nr:calphotin-like [Aedes albopictus]
MTTEQVEAYYSAVVAVAAAVICTNILNVGVVERESSPNACTCINRTVLLEDPSPIVRPIPAAQALLPARPGIVPPAAPSLTHLSTVLLEDPSPIVRPIPAAQALLPARQDIVHPVILFPADRPIPAAQALPSAGQDIVHPVAPSPIVRPIPAAQALLPARQDIVHPVVPFPAARPILAAQALPSARPGIVLPAPFLITHSILALHPSKALSVHQEIAPPIVPLLNTLPQRVADWFGVLHRFGSPDRISAVCPETAAPRFTTMAQKLPKNVPLIHLSTVLLEDPSPIVRPIPAAQALPSAGQDIVHPVAPSLIHLSTVLLEDPSPIVRPIPAAQALLPARQDIVHPVVPFPAARPILAAQALPSARPGIVLPAPFLITHSILALHPSKALSVHQEIAPPIVPLLNTLPQRVADWFGVLHRFGSPDRISAVCPETAAPRFTTVSSIGSLIDATFVPEGSFLMWMIILASSSLQVFAQEACFRT